MLHEHQKVPKLPKKGTKYEQISKNNKTYQEVPTEVTCVVKVEEAWLVICFIMVSQNLFSSSSFAAVFYFLMFGVNGVICWKKSPRSDSFKSLQSLVLIPPWTKKEENKKFPQKLFSRNLGRRSLVCSGPLHCTP